MCLLRSNLLPHQKIAIDFIFKRETGELPRELSLWELNKDDEASEQKLFHPRCLSIAESRNFESTYSPGDRQGLIKHKRLLSMPSS
ncbi:hypothetical protein Cob_v001769 [Colletotrichum orbiculare MAFF 240422]|uniref:Uncharacterized protein n=1 Tax=Colletotrichum orbiculare (strain 104-T / ATCC 96160 / CBS 514.97 / LARS 414 / MAFF 240422) TaxID=1213857 RepID=A0A484G5A2_COLOR|nr:hypothetical protein Cob_v001769 [Colletotrichum orbiculare MAFF 240422]